MNKRQEEPIEDAEIRKLIKHAARTLPDVSFDDRVMMKIQAESAHKKQVAAQLNASLRFFATALIAAVLLSLMTLGFNSENPNVNIGAIMALFLFIVIAIMSFDNYRRLIRQYS